MTTANVRATTDQVLVHQLERRRWLDSQERYHQTESDHAIEMLGSLILIGLLFTACILAVWL